MTKKRSNMKNNEVNIHLSLDEVISMGNDN